MQNKIMVLGLAGALIALIVAGSLVYEEPIQRFESSQEMMDTYVSIAVYHKDETLAKEAMDAAFARMNEVAGIATRFNTSSELSELNANGYIDDPSPELVEMLELSVEYWNKTNGAFDITIMPLLDLWAFNSPNAPFKLFTLSNNALSYLDSEVVSTTILNAFSGHGYTLGQANDNIAVIVQGEEWNMTSGWVNYTVKKEAGALRVYTQYFWNVAEDRQEDFINEVRPLIGSGNITIASDKITIMPGMQLTLDGMAKGYIVDEGLKTLEEIGIEHALINAGGDIATLGIKPSGELWVTGLANPENRDESVTDFSLSGQAIATSGNYERYFNASAGIGHIMDPSTGRDVFGASSSTIIAPTCVEADIMATAAFVMGHIAGIQLIDDMEGFEALLLGYNDPTQIYRSNGLDEFENA